MRVDDYEHEKLDITNEQEELPLMTTSYQSFIGGVPQDVAFPHDSTASTQPFIGCVRDVLVDKEVKSCSILRVKTVLNILYYAFEYMI